MALSKYRTGSEYDEDALTAMLAERNTRMRGLFSFACAERLMPSYQWLCIVEKAVGYDVAREALDSGWAFIITGQIVELDRLRKKVIAAIPRASGSREFLTSTIAQNAGACVAYALEACRIGDVQSSVWSARQLYEAADSIVQQRSALHEYVNDPRLEEPVYSVTREIFNTFDDLIDLDVSQLRLKSQKDGIGFLRFVKGLE